MVRLQPILTWSGGIALLVMTLTDTLGVLGRHLGIPLHGSIELIQPAILFAGTLSLLAATVTVSHAKIHILVDRLSPQWRTWIGKIGSLLGIAFFVLLLIGSGWIAVDLWSGHEQSELVGVPWRWLRLFANAGLVAMILVLFVQFFARPKP